MGSNFQGPAVTLIFILLAVSEASGHQRRALKSSNSTHGTHKHIHDDGGVSQKVMIQLQPPSINIPQFISRNITLPFTLEELGWQVGRTLNSTVPPHRRLLQQASASAAQGLCRARFNVNYAGGGLEDVTLRIKAVRSAAACCNRCLKMSECSAWTWSSRTHICYPKGAVGWTATPLQGVTSGIVQRPVTPQPPPPAADGTLVWNPTLTLGDHALQKGFALETTTYPKANNKYVVTDPTGDTQEPVVKAVYQKGRWAPNQGQGGGVLFYAWPEGREGNLGKSVRLEYEVYFPVNFDWVKGGKLPGIMGGNTGCGGGANAESCFSVRIMWRREGDGEAYLYAPKAARVPHLCNTPGTICDDDAGISLMRGAIKFVKGRWMKLAITVHLNDVGQSNGLVDIAVDGVSKIRYDRMLFRRSSKIKAQAFIFATWFGGSDSSWSPDKTVEAYFRNFKIYKI